MTQMYMRGGVYFGTAEDMIDRIEELEADLQDAHRVGAEWFEQSKQNHKRATTAEAKLAKAEETLRMVCGQISVEADVPYETWADFSYKQTDQIFTTIAELTGGKEDTIGKVSRDD